MSLSTPFILRPIGTSLVAGGIFLLGAVAYFDLPVANLPDIEPRLITVQANLPGASPETIAATVAAPLERQIGTIAGVRALTSESQTGSTAIAVEFDRSRNLDAAAIDVQAAINAAQAELPGALPERPTLRKAASSPAPLMILAVTSPLRPEHELYDLAELAVATRIARVQGVGAVSAFGSQRSAIRIAADPAKLKSLGLGLEDLRIAIVQANALGPSGTLDGPFKSAILRTNGELCTAAGYEAIPLKARKGAIVQIRDVAAVTIGPSSRLSAGYVNGSPAAGIIVQKTPGANAIETVRRIEALLPAFQTLLPADVQVSVLTDRTLTVRKSIAELELTLALSAALIVMFVFWFLGRAAPAFAAGATVPLALAATVTLIWVLGYSLNTISLLALTIAAGLIADDAVVMTDACSRSRERGASGAGAALEGSRQVGVTIVSMSVSLAAAFVPLLFLDGEAGQLLRELAWILIGAAAMSAVSALTVTPAICAHLNLFQWRPGRKPGRRMDSLSGAPLRLYARWLEVALRHKTAVLVFSAAALATAVPVYLSLPRELLPQAESDFVFAFAQAPLDTAFEKMTVLQSEIASRLRSDADVKTVAVTIGNGADGSSNAARFYITLLDASQRSAPAAAVISRLREHLAGLTGVQISVFALPELELSGTGGQASNELTLWSANLHDLEDWLPPVIAALQRIPGMLDVSSGRSASASQILLTIDRIKAAKFGVSAQDIEGALDDAFAERRISTIYDDRAQYNVILEVSPDLVRSQDALQSLFVKGPGSKQVALLAVAAVSRTAVPFAVQHIGQFPAIKIGFNLAEGARTEDVLSSVSALAAELSFPDSLHLEPSGATRAAAHATASLPAVILMALVAVYLVLGVLYEDLMHPLTVLSTLPFAAIGALMALKVSGYSLSVVSLIGIVFLIGVVKRNGILLVDFALTARRARGLSAGDAIREACLERFRPIVMTNLIAMLGALPLLLAAGPGAELRAPLGATILGGLFISLLFTGFVTPAIYLTAETLVRAKKSRLA